MPLGERIGDAYVKIHGDGRGFDQDVRQGIKDLNKTLEKDGRQAGEPFAEGFSDGFKKGLGKQFFRDALDEAFGRDQGRIRKIASIADDLAEAFRDRFGDRLGGRLSDLVLSELRDGTRDIDLDMFADLSRLIKRASIDLNIETREIAEAWEHMLDEALADNEAFDRKVREDRDKTFDLEHRRLVQAAADWEDTLNDAYRMNLEFDQKVSEDRDILFRLEHNRLAQAAADWEDMLAQAHAMNQRFNQQVDQDNDRRFQSTINQMNGLREELAELEKQLVRTEKGTTTFGDSTTRLREHVRRLSKDFDRMGDETDAFGNKLRDSNDRMRETDESLRDMRLRLVLLTPHIDKARRGFGRLADTVGRLTGRGSRNDFLNFVGSVNRNVLRTVGALTLGLTKATVSTIKFFDALRTGAVEVRDIKTAIGGIGNLIASGITGLVTFGVVIAAISVSVGILSAALSGLAAALTAFAGSLAFAASAGVGALAGSLVPLAAGIGVVIAAFQGLSDAQKEALGHDLDPLQDAFGRIADLAGDFLFRDVGQWAKDLAPLITQLEPAVVRVANSIHNTIDDLVNDLAESDKVEHFIDRLVNRTDSHMSFLGTATAKIGDIFVNIGEGMAGVFLATIPLINRFLGWLRDITQEFSEWANTAEGRKDIREFFEKAGDSASALGDFLGDATRALGHLLDLGREHGDEMFREMADAMERFVTWITSPQGQKAAEDWFEWGKELAGVLGDLVVAAGEFIGAMDTPAMRQILTTILDAFILIFDTIGKIGPEIGLVLLGPLGAVAFAVIKVKDGVQALFDLLNLNVEGGWLGTVADILGNITNPIGGFVDAIGAAKDMLFGGGEKESFLAEVFRDIESGAGGAKEAIGGIIESLDQVTGAATEATRALILTNAENQGYIDTAAGLGVSARTVVNAILGQKGALKEVNAALFRAATSTGGLTAEEEALREAIGLSSGFLKKEREEIIKNAIVIQDFKGKLQGIPKRVRLQIEESGIVRTTKGLATVVEAAKDLAPNLSQRQIKTIISAAGVEPTKKLIRQVMALVEDMDNAEAEASVDLDTKPFDGKNKQVNQDLKITDKQEAVPSVSMDLRQFLNDRGKVMGDLTALSRETSEPSVRLNMGGFFDDRQAVINGLVTIPDETVNVFLRPVRQPGNEGGGPIEPGPTGREVRPSAPSPAPTINVYPQASDPEAVAQATLNRIVAMSY